MSAPEIGAGLMDLEPAMVTHPCWRLSSSRRSHRHWFQDNAVMPTCERCGTLIDREHKEVGPVCWEPEKRREIVTIQDRYAISTAAMRALGEWLAWPDSGRDGAREVTVQQTLSFLKGLPNKLGYSTPKPADPTSEAVERVKNILRGPDGEEYTDAGMEDAFFRWPVIERAIRAALATNAPEKVKG
jgi:hypothetical protein